MVRVLQLLNGSRISAAIFMGKSLYGGGIVFAAMYQLFFLVALDLLRNPRRFHGKGNQHQREREHHGQQHIAGLC